MSEDDWEAEAERLQSTTSARVVPKLNVRNEASPRPSASAVPTSLQHGMQLLKQAELLAEEHGVYATFAEEDDLAYEEGVLLQAERALLEAEPGADVDGAQPSDRQLAMLRRGEDARRTLAPSQTAAAIVSTSAPPASWYALDPGPRPVLAVDLSAFAATVEGQGDGQGDGYGEADEAVGHSDLRGEAADPYAHYTDDEAEDDGDDHSGHSGYSTDGEDGDLEHGQGAGTTTCGKSQGRDAGGARSQSDGGHSRSHRTKKTRKHRSKPKRGQGQPSSAAVATAASPAPAKRQPQRSLRQYADLASDVWRVLTGQGSGVDDARHGAGWDDEDEDAAGRAGRQLPVLGAVRLADGWPKNEDGGALYGTSRKTSTGPSPSPSRSIPDWRPDRPADQPGLTHDDHGFLLARAVVLRSVWSGQGGHGDNNASSRSSNTHDAHGSVSLKVWARLDLRLPLYRHGSSPSGPFGSHNSSVGAGASLARGCVDLDTWCSGCEALLSSRLAFHADGDTLGWSAGAWAEARARGHGSSVGQSLLSSRQAATHRRSTSAGDGQVLLLLPYPHLLSYPSSSSSSASSSTGSSATGQLDRPVRVSAWWDGLTGTYSWPTTAPGSSSGGQQDASVTQYGSYGAHSDSGADVADPAAAAVDAVRDTLASCQRDLSFKTALWSHVQGLALAMGQEREGLRRARVTPRPSGWVEHGPVDLADCPLVRLLVPVLDRPGPGDNHWTPADADEASNAADGAGTAGSSSEALQEQRSFVSSDPRLCTAAHGLHLVAVTIAARRGEGIGRHGLVERLDRSLRQVAPWVLSAAPVTADLLDLWWTGFGCLPTEHHSRLVGQYSGTVEAGQKRLQQAAEERASAGSNGSGKGASGGVRAGPVGEGPARDGQAPPFLGRGASSGDGAGDYEDQAVDEDQNDGLGPTEADIRAGRLAVRFPRLDGAPGFGSSSSSSTGRGSTNSGRGGYGGGSIVDALEASTAGADGLGLGLGVPGPSEALLTSMLHQLLRLQGAPGQGKETGMNGQGAGGTEDVAAAAARNLLAQDKASSAAAAAAGTACGAGQGAAPQTQTRAQAQIPSSTDPLGLLAALMQGYAAPPAEPANGPAPTQGKAKATTVKAQSQREQPDEQEEQEQPDWEGQAEHRLRSARAVARAQGGGAAEAAPGVGAAGRGGPSSVRGSASGPQPPATGPRRLGSHLGKLGSAFAGLPGPGLGK